MTETERLRAALLHIRATAAGTKREKVDATLHLVTAIVDAALAPPQPTPDTRPTLTARQAEVLACIKQYQRERGYSPTVRDIGTRLGIGSPNGVMCHLKVLERTGYLLRDSNVARAISVLEAT